MKKLLLITFLFSTYALANLFKGSPQDATFIISGKKIEFLRYGVDVLISKNCLKDGKLKCDATEGVKGIYPQSVDASERSWGSEMGMILCSDLNKGVPMIGRPVGSRAETSFCKFKDGTYLSSSAYPRAARMNAKKMGIKEEPSVGLKALKIKSDNKKTDNK
jgi:hypothetical protein